MCYFSIVDYFCQVTGLRKHGVEVTMVTSATPTEEQSRVHTAMSDPNSNLKLVYVTPEKISKAKRYVAAVNI